MPLLPLCSQINVGAAVNSLLGDTFSRENNTHGSRLHDRDPQFASRILGAMTQSCYIGTRDIRSRVIRGPYCIVIRFLNFHQKLTFNRKSTPQYHEINVIHYIWCRMSWDLPCGTENQCHDFDVMGFGECHEIYVQWNGGLAVNPLRLNAITFIQI